MPRSQPTGALIGPLSVSSFNNGCWDWAKIDPWTCEEDPRSRPKGGLADPDARYPTREERTGAEGPWARSAG